jgi:putative redox protein
MIKHYTKGDLTVVWQPDLCRHGGACARGLGAVFSPRRRPWIDLSQADDAAIVAQVERCPTGALSWIKKEPSPQ